jgi:2'-5' RNA ligase superfamily
MTHAPDKAPFIVTAELPGDVFAWANSLRTAHFPSERNHLKAHVTLFHSFAPSLRAELPRELARLAREFAPPICRTNGPMDLGGGTAIALHSPAMLAVREEIAETFYTMLTAQDRGGKKLHITVQNKVERAAAKSLQAELSGQLDTREFSFTGLGLHLYLGPQWEEVGVWKFRGKNHA